MSRHRRRRPVSGVVGWLALAAAFATAAGHIARLWWDQHVPHIGASIPPGIGRWVVLVIVVIAVSASAVAVARRLPDRDGPVVTLAQVDAMTGPQFEQLVAALLTRDGYQGAAASGGAGDLGADVTAWRPAGTTRVGRVIGALGLPAGREKVVVQCKRYTNDVGSPDVQRFAGTCRQIHGADLPVFVTSAGFTRQAADCAAQCGITTVDRGQLGDWLAGRPLRLPTRIRGRRPEPTTELEPVTDRDGGAA